MGEYSFYEHLRLGLNRNHPLVRLFNKEFDTNIFGIYYNQMSKTFYIDNREATLTESQFLNQKINKHKLLTSDRCYKELS